MDGEPGHERETPRTVRELLEAVHAGDLPVVYATATASMVQLALEDLVELESQLYDVREENAALREELARLRHRRLNPMETNDHPTREHAPGALPPGEHGNAHEPPSGHPGGHRKNS